MSDVGTTTMAETEAPMLPGEAVEYEYLRDRVSSANTSGPLFTTSASGLFEKFLAAIPADRRNHYKCHACRHFFNRYGGLARILPDGSKHSVFWGGGFSFPRKSFFREAVQAVKDEVDDSHVTGVFLNPFSQWGFPCTHDQARGRDWTHFYAPHRDMHNPGSLSTCYADMAQKREDYVMLSRALGEFPIDVVRVAHTILASGDLYRSEKVVGVARWLLALHEARAGKSSDAKRNLAWLAAATAPPGYCHVRTTMISTLLEDIAAGKTYVEAKRAFDAKMSPVKYQRPQAPPKAGQIAAAESVVAKLESAGSLRRRYATMSDIRHMAVWLENPIQTPSKRNSIGVFSHLLVEQTIPKIELPAQVITWAKFSREVLPIADRIEWKPGRVFDHRAVFGKGISLRHHPLFAFLTAVDMSSPPILQWDQEAVRNPVSWYLYHGGSLPDWWGLIDAWHQVDGIFLQPNTWTKGQSDHQGNGAYFVIRGAYDKNARTVGLGLFPEILRSEYHHIRSAIEAYSKAGRLPLDGLDSPACGVALQKSHQGSWDEVFRVHSRGTTLLYKLDRWD